MPFKAVKSRARRCRKWSRPEDALVRKMHAAGETQSEIADVLGRSVAAIARRYTILHLHDPHRSRRSSEWAAHEIEILREMRAAGRDLEEMSNRLGRTPKAVECKIHILKLPLAPKRVKQKPLPRAGAYKYTSPKSATTGCIWDRLATNSLDRAEPIPMRPRHAKILKTISQPKRLPEGFGQFRPVENAHV